MHDPEWDALVQSFRERNPADRRQTARDLAAIASVYKRHEHHWLEFNEARGIASLELGRKAVSEFHPMCRHLCRLGLAGDDTGRASVLAGFLDIWKTTDIAPKGIPAWIAGAKGGIRGIYNSKGRRFPDLIGRVLTDRDSNVHSCGILASGLSRPRRSSRMISVLMHVVAAARSSTRCPKVGVIGARSAKGVISSPMSSAEASIG